MIPTLANRTHILKASLLSDKTSQTISLHQLLMKIIHSGMFVLNSADQKIIWIGFIVDIQNIFHFLHFYIYIVCTMIHYLKNKVGVVDFANAQGLVMF